MRTLFLNRDRMDAMLRGAATIFDLSGTGLLPDARFGSLGVDLEDLRKDFEVVGDDFWTVLRSEPERLKKEFDVGRR